MVLDLANPLFRLVHAEILGKLVTFCVPERQDPIVRHHGRGEFYELPELGKLSHIIPKDGVIVDIGSNIGNHSLFFALFLKASKIFPFEPNKEVYDVLISNVIVNGVYDVFDFSYLGVGVSDKNSGGFGVEKRDRNQGAAKMIAGEGDIDVVRVDEALKNENPVLIKIDVEGMELQALNGLSGILKRCRPVIMIEVDIENEEPFNEWLRSNDYGIVHTHQRYRRNKNHILVDKNAVAETLEILGASETQVKLD